MGFEDLNQALKVAKKEIETFQTHISEAPKDVTKAEAKELINTINNTFEQFPDAGKMDANVSTQVNRQLVKDVNNALQNLFNFINNNPQVNKLISSLVGIRFKQEVEEFQKKLREKQADPRAPHLKIVAKVEKSEKGGLNKGKG